MRETVELGDTVVVRALAGGTVTGDGPPRRRRLEWLARYRVTGSLISEIELLAVTPLGDG